MTDKYTPTTDGVRRTYFLFRHAKDRALKQDPDNSDAIDEFDRWLADHDREVAAKVLREAAERVEPLSGAPLPTGPSRGQVADWLRDRAADIESGELTT